MRVDPITRDLALVAGDLDAQQPVVDAVRLRLHTERGSCFWDRDFGSNLHLLGRTKVTTQTQATIEDMIRTALAPMTQADELTIDGFTHERPAVDRWHTQVVLRDQGRRPVRFDLFLKVGG